MRTEPQIAFCPPAVGPPGLEVRVNFGMFAGRDATPAEIDDLGNALLPIVGEVTVVSEQRRELTVDGEAALHQVRVEIAGDRLPRDEGDVDELCGRLVERAERWAHACIDKRHADVAEP